MQFINYSFASLLSFFGLLIGIFLLRIAPDEQKQLKRYFILLRRIILILIFIFLLFYYFSSIFYLSSLVAFFLFMVLLEFKVKNMPKNSLITSSALGILFFLSSKNINLFAIVSALAFLYGLPTASLIYNKKEKNHFTVVINNIGFLIMSNVLYFL